MLQSVLIFFLSVQTIGPSLAPNDVKSALARAESLYYEAKFKDAIQLLMSVDDQLRQNPGRLEERTTTKLQLALANIGLNDVDKAKVFLRELFDIDPDYQLDPEQFSPKVVALAVDARKEGNEIRCRTSVDDGSKYLKNGSTGALVDLVTSMGSKCPGLAALQPQAAELLYKRGLDSYKKGDFKGALPDLRNAMKLDPKNELASDYAGLAESKMQLTADRLMLDWRKDFDEHQFSNAAAKYREISVIANAQMLTQVQTAYRSALTALVQQWNRACPTGDTAAKDSIRSQIDALLPEPSFGQDIRSQMSECNKVTGCVLTNSHIVMTRLRTRVNPEISREMRALIRDTSAPVRVKLRIDEKGNTSVTDVQGYVPLINSAVRSAVERWKFAPAVDENGPRCVDSEIVVSIER